VLDRSVYRPSALRPADVQVAVAKQGCKAKMAPDAAHETINSTTKLVYFCCCKLVVDGRTFNGQQCTGHVLATCAGGKQVLGSRVHLGEAGFSLMRDGRYFSKHIYCSSLLLRLLCWGVSVASRYAGCPVTQGRTLHCLVVYTFLKCPI
jgi:hypothetical protein